MALKKSIVLPGWGQTYEYIRLDSTERHDHLQRTIKVNLRLYTNESVAKDKSVRAQSHPFGCMILSGPGYDAYASKEAIEAGKRAVPPVDAIELQYRALKALAVAYEARAAKPPTITDAQKLLLDSGSEYSGPIPMEKLPLSGMTDA